MENKSRLRIPVEYGVAIEALITNKEFSMPAFELSQSLLRLDDNVKINIASVFIVRRPEYFDFFLLRSIELNIE